MKIYIFILIIGIVLLSGCWDKVEIDKRAFITAIGIDSYEIEKEEDNQNKFKDRYNITYEYPNLDYIGKDSSGPPRFTISSTGNNVYQISRQSTTRTDKVFTFSHTKAIIFGKDFLNTELFQKVMDTFERDPVISKKAYVLIASDSAQEILEAELESEPIIGTYISGAMERTQVSSRYNKETTGDLVSKLHETNGCAIIPRITKHEDELKIAGSGVIKGYKFIGWLGEIETRGFILLTDKVKYDEITVVYKDLSIPYVLTGTSIKKHAYIDENGTIHFVFDLVTEGYTKEYILDSTEHLLEKKVLENIEKKLEIEIEKQALKTINKLQQVFNVDVIGVQEYLSKYEPDIWETVKEQWETEFKKVKISVKVDSKLRRTGLAK